MKRKPQPQGQPLKPGVAIETYLQPDGTFIWRIVETAVLAMSYHPVASEETALEQAQVALAAMSFAFNLLHDLERQERQAARRQVEAN